MIVYLMGYYLLALQGCSPQSELTIHGLWPQYNDGNWPSYCHNVTFTPQMIQPIRNQLDQYWPSCINQESKHFTDFTFWNHEIQKHYSCLFVDIPVLEYMNTTLNLYQTAKANDFSMCQNSTSCKIPVNLLFRIET